VRTKIFREYSKSQGFLLPPSLDKFVPENHEARIINDVVDAMDLSPLLAKYEGGGAPAYHPAMMLKVFSTPTAGTFTAHEALLKG
jgi:transposase